MTDQNQITTEDVRRIAQEVVAVALDDVPTLSDVERIVGAAIEKQSRVNDERDEKRAHESYDMMNSVDRHLRAVEITMGQVAQTVAEFKGVISTLPDLKANVGRLETELTAQATAIAVVEAGYVNLKEDIFGESTGKPPSLYRLLEHRAARADQQHDAVMKVLQEDISPRLERAENYIESRRALEQRVFKAAQLGWKYIAASKVRFTVFAVGASLVAARLLDPAMLDSIGQLLRAILGGG